MTDIARTIRALASANASLWGLKPEAAVAWAAVQWILPQLGIPVPEVISGFRSPQRQGELYRAWVEGRRDGLASKPARRSWHIVGRAIDIQTDSPGFEAAKVVLQAFGARWGGNFQRPSPGHFDWPDAAQPPDFRDVTTPDFGTIRNGQR